MSRSQPPTFDVGCPECGTSLDANIPPGPGLRPGDSQRRLRGTEQECQSCGHELSIYYY